MAVVARFLIDTSAESRMTQPLVADVVAPIILEGLAATCASLDLEALYSARSPADYEQSRQRRSEAYEYLPTLDCDWQRALAVQRQLAALSRWREVGLQDLVIAAVSEREGVTIVHYDSDFETIASITRQRTMWVTPPGSAS